MRSEEEIYRLILSVAKKDDRIRAVVLNGSRANDKIKKDSFQDFDILFLVNELESFNCNPNWIDVFGERIIFQTPNSMKLYNHDVNLDKEEICYLMLFKDYNRIDLTILKIEHKYNRKDSLTKILLDKDNIYETIPIPNDKDYWVKQPTQKQFDDCCNEFWWVSTYVVKGIRRNELIYASHILDTVVRKMFMRLIAWNVAAENKFEINLGASNRFIHNYLDSNMLSQIENTYSSLDKVEMWNCLVSMTEIFERESNELTKKLGLNFNIYEAKNVKEYILRMKDEN